MAENKACNDDCGDAKVPACCTWMGKSLWPETFFGVQIFQRLHCIVLHGNRGRVIGAAESTIAGPYARVGKCAQRASGKKST